MDQQARSTLSVKALIGAAFLAVLFSVALPADAQESFRLERDDGWFPLSPSQVIELQEGLAKLGFDVGPVDGVVGPRTVRAAKALAAMLEREMVRRPSGREIVLNCEIEEGGPQQYRSIQIMIDEHRGIVIYNFHLPAMNDFNPVRRSGPGYIDLSMKITMNDEKLIMANDDSGAFVMRKHDGRFVKAFVTPVPTKDGSWFALGNTHSGKCVKNPFQ